MRVSLAQVMAWPDEHVRLQLAFMAAEPPTSDRLEAAIAQLTALVANLGGGGKGKSTGDYLMFPDPWGASEAKARAGLTGEELQLIGHLSRKSRPA